MELNVRKFLQDNPAKYYVIRDKAKAGGVFKLSVEKDKVIQEIQEYSEFSINVSSANYAKNQVLVGEIQILSNNDVYAMLSTKPGYSVRNAIKNPDFNIKTNIVDKNIIDNIPYFDYLYSYIISNNLQDVIIEFAMFNVNVGINNENIVIYELRAKHKNRFMPLEEIEVCFDDKSNIVINIYEGERLVGALIFPKFSNREINFSMQYLYDNAKLSVPVRRSLYILKPKSAVKLYESPNNYELIKLSASLKSVLAEISKAITK